MEPRDRIVRIGAWRALALACAVLASWAALVAAPARGQEAPAEPPAAEAPATPAPEAAPAAELPAAAPPESAPTAQAPAPTTQAPAPTTQAPAPAPKAEAPAPPPPAATAEKPPEKPAAEKPTAEDFAAPMGPADPFNRGTPRGSMYGFIVACREGNFDRAAEYLDLRRLPDPGEGRELARKLKTVLDRKLWIEFANLSDSNEGAPNDGLPAWQDRLGTIKTAKGAVDLLLQRVPRKGDGTRIWKISAATVDEIEALHDEFGPTVLEQYLPLVLFQHQVLSIWLWQWGGLALLALLSWGVSLLLATVLIRVLHRAFARDGKALDRRIVRVVQGPVRLLIAVVIFAAGTRSLGLPLVALDTMRTPLWMLATLSLAWLAMRLLDIASVVLSQRLVRSGGESAVAVLAPARRIAKAVILMLGLLAVLAAAGVNITAAVAGLGVGGIAVALAAQKTLENLFGGLTLFADRPVKVGDFFRYGDQVGTVEEIGLRSTRVRTLDRTVVSVPNSEFSNLHLENFAARDRMRLWTVLGVRYETTSEQLRYLLARLRELLLAHPRITEDPARVRFVGFGAYSLDLEIFAYVDTQDWNEFLEIREDIFLRIIDIVAEAGTGFAFPSSTMYLGRDEGLDEKRAQEAETRVREWREKGALPFPRFPEPLVREKWNTLDWPPAGSPGSPGPGRPGGAPRG